MVPVVHVSRADLPLRTETLHVLRLLQLDPAQLVCLGDDLDLAALPADRVDVTLVDHNALAMPLRSLSPRVSAVFDHHTVSQGSASILPVR